MIFTYVNPVDLHKHWNTVRCGIESILDKTEEPFIPEDVYASVKTGASHLYLVDNGFVVLQNIKESYTNDPILFVWLAWHTGEEDLSDFVYDELNKIAKSIGAKTIQWTSPRRWTRRVGARLKSYNYELPVGEMK